jgi:hypothetical protein
VSIGGDGSPPASSLRADGDGSEQRVSVASGSPGTTAGGTMFTYARSKEMIKEDRSRC